MPLTTFNHTVIKAIYSSIPPHRRSIDDDGIIAGYNQKQIDRIKKTIGLNHRHVVDANMTALDLCRYAAEKLFNDKITTRESIDGLIFVTQTPDHFQPSNASILHGNLGIDKDCAAFDVNLGCSGYVYGLWIGHLMIESGACNNILLFAGDTLSRCVHPKDKSVAFLFGDAGTVTLMSRAKYESPAFFSMKTDGTGHHNLIIPAGAFRLPKSTKTTVEDIDHDGNVRTAENLFMNGAEIFSFSIKVEPQSIKDILEYSGKLITDIDNIVFHQANKYIIGNIARRLKIQLEKVPSGTVEKYGNQSSASIPVTICDALAEEVKQHCKRKMILSGFGVGLSWATCLIEMTDVPTKICFYP